MVNLDDFPEIGGVVACITYFAYALLILTGHFRDFLGKLSGWTRYKEEVPRKGFAILLKSWESFYTRRLYGRINDCWNRPIASFPGANIEVMERKSTNGNYSYDFTGRTMRCLNVGSYNYLGFADDWRKSCGDRVLDSLEQWPISMCSSSKDYGYTKLHEELEDIVARFVNKESAMVYGMGFGTNATTIPSLMGPGCLIISDSLNHTSIVNGARSSSAVIRIFHHNDPAHLQQILREAISQGQPRHHRPWKKILVMIEGIYSMEGTVSKLPEILQVTKKHKAYLYVDEAHSIGALGKTGRGVCEFTGVNHNDIDILMGTFTKSFGGMGGYIAGSKELINHLKSSSAGYLYHNAMSPVVCEQIITSFRIILGLDGTNLGVSKLNQLYENSVYFRHKLLEMGLHVYGQDGSPIIPIMIYVPTKLAAFSRECLKRGLAVVVVGFPATSVVLSRARFCISAAHTREELDGAIRIIDEVTGETSLATIDNLAAFFLNLST
eukprot:gene9476-19684_t